MPTPIKSSEISKLLPRRDKFSHKGENGRLLIVGGSIDYFGAPILAGMGALGGGADLVYLLVPECNFEVSRGYYPDFIVHKYKGDYVNENTVLPAVELAQKSDVILIGPGISENKEGISAILKIIKSAKCQIILDAEAIPAIAHLGLQPNANSPHPITITPHHREMEQILGHEVPEVPKDIEEAVQVAQNFSTKWGITILLKGQTDIIASPGHPTKINETGNAGMTSGGTGDVLAGLTASLISQHAKPYHACLCAAFLNGLAGDNLYRRKGFNFTATDLALELPYTIKGLI